MEKWYHLSNITKTLESIFSVVKYNFISYCIPILFNSMNIWPETHDLYVDLPYTGSRTFEEYSQWSRFSAGKWQIASSKIFSVTLPLGIILLFVPQPLWILEPFSFPCTCMFPLAQSFRQTSIMYAEELPFNHFLIYSRKVFCSHYIRTSQLFVECVIKLMPTF